MIRKSFFEAFPEAGHVRLFSAPGRTEIGGNHTDHNHGRVLAGAVEQEIIAACSPAAGPWIRIFSEGFEPIAVNTGELAPRADERGKTPALVRGICARMSELGYAVGGVYAYLSSSVPAGSGLSSSAAFEVLIVTILSALFNGGAITPLETAQISRYAEGEYFGKPCGLMDQIACAFGGLLTADFENAENPVVSPVNFSFDRSGHKLCIVKTKGDHANLTDDYKSIREEMELVARSFGKSFLREVKEAEFFSRFSELARELPGRAVLRAYHFFNENNRVLKQVQALEEGRFTEFLKLVGESGRSSFQYNQNVYSPRDIKGQSLALGLALSERALGSRGAVRVHGGGFAGTIQAFVPDDLLDEYIEKTEAVFGEGACLISSIRKEGAKELF